MVRTPLMMLCLAGVGVIVAAAAVPGPVHAQVTDGLVVASCGAQTLTAGRTAQLSQDATGKFCTNSSGSSGGVVTEVAGGFVDLTTIISSLATLNSNSTSAIAAGTAIIGGVYPPLGYAAIATNQVSVLTTATRVLVARTGAPGTGRGDTTITDEGSASVWCGTSAVTISTGALIAAGGARVFKTTGEVWCIAASATQTVDYVEDF